MEKKPVALVTGASQGIGRDTALALSEAGAKVAVAARNEEKLTALVAARDLEAKLRATSGTLGRRCAASIWNTLKMSIYSRTSGLMRTPWWLWVDSNHRPQHYECCALTG